MAQGMQDALSKMLADSGLRREDLARGPGRLAKTFRRQGVQRDAELERILWLPARTWQDNPNLEMLRLGLTMMLRAPGGTMELWPHQAQALADTHDFGGSLLPIPVGKGKTLVSLLLPVVTGFLPALLLVPAKLVGKTRMDFADLRRDWNAVEPQVLSYQKISRSGGWGRLEEINPKLIIADEAHWLKNTDAGVTRKLRRWHREHPETRACFMSGRISSRSLREYAHLAEWSLGQRCPMPLRHGILKTWRMVIDEKVPEGSRMAPGALLALCNDAELDSLAQDQSPVNALSVVRKAYKRRLVSTPGVVAVESKGLEIPITLEIERPVPGSATWPAFEKLRTDWETPDGHPFSEPMDLWRHARDLVCGFYNVWDPRPPADWLHARREWHRFVRDIRNRRYKDIDTPFQVVLAIKKGKLQSKEYNEWIKVRDTFKPNSVPVWIDDALIKWCGGWLRKRDPTIVWTDDVPFGKKLSKDLGLPYFQREGKDSTGRHIERLDKPEHVIASVQSNNEGRNLQHMWHNSLVISAEPKGSTWHQLIGRTHREGQEADDVEVNVVVACLEQWEGLRQARRDEEFARDTTVDDSKLLLADWVGMPTDAEVRALQISGDPMWKK
jgi:hypothetical protein